MKVTKVYKTGDKTINEDNFVINGSNRIYAAIDGATGLAGVPGQIASQVVKHELEEKSTNKTLHDRVELANEQLALKIMEYFNEHIRTVNEFEEIHKEERSSTGLAAIQLDEARHYFDYIQAGDCMLFLQYENGDIRTITFDHVQQLDQMAVREIIKLRNSSGNHDLGIKELLEKVKPILLTNRNKLNTFEGYGIIDGSKEAMENLEYGRVSMRRVKKILLLSDGLTMPTQDPNQDGWKLSVEFAFQHGLDALLEEVSKREESDPECVVYPRLKPRDDKTGVLIEV
ncbi:protein phosphatase 2C domain-containing protein [Paucisalibacillus sp. EB02]|uniref:protein phosphatase 2C domain-containing protein n=1 Tax=Paucisalibacillus sp. EB02 TaxID=1347087 RepID=UPI0004B372E0|nr:protein phosphatase 2C domain-containing protein [Paucisalibacillus sp. EB02]